MAHSQYTAEAQPLTQQEIKQLPKDGGQHYNRLIFEQSPYLLQHADNPVDWYPWGDEAFERAKAEDKPVFLSIGYSTCHWCHVMAHESFEDPETAEQLNEAFICIKVDREERPDLDQVYMSSCQLMTGSGGWPLTVILTPDKQPFYAGTYFPQTNRFGRIGLSEPDRRNYGHLETSAQ
ncbi:MAG: thioredoxin domain-containing protein [candidate division KSB1 bacterium]|nr:thioredoxin domain-containing protein [candidate division KSB1 bacterium]